MLVNQQQSHHGMEFLLATPLWYNSKLIPWKITTWAQKRLLQPYNHW